jgi:predicted transcriptional regulator
MPYQDPSAHKQARIKMSAEDYEELQQLADAEERSVSYVAGRLIREALAKRNKRPITPLD